LFLMTRPLRLFDLMSVRPGSSLGPTGCSLAGVSEDERGHFVSDNLPERRQYSFEFRHPSWYAPRILRALADRNIALCISDHHDAPAPWERTADFVYLRGHGPQGRYQGRYSRARLSAWRKSIIAWQHSRCDVYVYFDNDQKSAAPMDALALLRLLAR
jgi:uncharacterized protein YecE (DUF72 family)